MASPLRFLRRLVSRRGERNPDAEKVDDAKSGVVAHPDPIEAQAEEGLADTARPAGFEASSRDPADAVSKRTASMDEAETRTFDAADSNRTDIAAGDSSPPRDDTGNAVSAAHDGAERQEAVKGSARRQTNKSKAARPVVVSAQSSQAFRPPLDDAKSLDEEINVLRGQLASRLKIQNAQLKKMLERFER